MELGKKKKGVTLIELVIALGLLSIISTLIFSFFFINKKKLDEVSIKADLQYEAKVAMDTISKYAMDATSVKVDNETSPGKITFSLIDESGAKIEDGAVFNINKPEITLEVKAKGGSVILSKIICSNLNTIKVSVNESKNIYVNLMLEKKDISYSVEESFLLRNIHLK